MAEAIPGGWGQAVEWSVENVSRAARIAVELGADIVKTVCPGPPESPRMQSEDDVVAVARGVVQAGAAGIAFGRNVWGSPDPTSLVARLADAVHA
jgi:DhnA family fructose-bisphosphate aldolase class Ia